MTQAERRARTRQRLLNAASEVFAADGYHSATVARIAAHAGHSTGAVYAHFANKEELFLALVDEHVQQQIKHYVAAARGDGDAGARSRSVADEWMGYIRGQPDYFPIFIAFWSYAIRKPSLKPRLAERLASFKEVAAELIAEGARELGIPLVEGYPEQVGIVATALGNGLALHKLADPDGVPDELFGDILALFMTALSALAREVAATSAQSDGVPQSATTASPVEEGDAP